MHGYSRTSVTNNSQSDIDPMHGSSNESVLGMESPFPLAPYPASTVMLIIITMNITIIIADISLEQIRIGLGHHGRHLGGARGGSSRVGRRTQQKKKKKKIEPNLTFRRTSGSAWRSGRAEVP